MSILGTFKGGNSHKKTCIYPWQLKTHFTSVAWAKVPFRAILLMQKHGGSRSQKLILLMQVVSFDLEIKQSQLCLLQSKSAQEKNAKIEINHHTNGKLVQKWNTVNNLKSANPTKPIVLPFKKAEECFPARGSWEEGGDTKPFVWLQITSPCSIYPRSNGWDLYDFTEIHNVLGKREYWCWLHSLMIV